MAELAIGISKTAFQLLADKVKSAIKLEAEQWQIVQRDIVFIKDEFEMMQSFLSTPDGERMKNEVARTWRAQVRDLSSDTEDCIEFVLHLDTKQSWWLRLLPNQLISYYRARKAMLPLDEAVAEIQLLKARAEEVNQRNMRYSNIGDTGEGPTTKMMLETSAASQSTSDIFIKQRDAFHDQHVVSKLIKLIDLDGDSLQVTSVCGIGGDLGIISIMKKVYDFKEIRASFTYRAWVKLTSPFSIHEFVRNMFAQFDSTHKSYTSEEENLDLPDVKILKNIIKSNRCLIVLEDVTSLGQWHAIMALMTKKNEGSSRILVSTQQLEVASLCTEQPSQAYLLSKDSTDHSAVYAFTKELTPELTRKILNENDSSRIDYDKEYCESSGPLQEGTSNSQNSTLWHYSEAEKLKKQIKSALSDRTRHVISVRGITGVGKSFLVKTVCEKLKKENDKLDYDMISACRLLDMEFRKRLSYDSDKGGVQEDRGGIAGWLREVSMPKNGRRCLVLVIDDVQDTEDWDLIKANVSRDYEGCIIVTTRQESIARHCATSDDAVWKIKGLEADKVCDIFKQSFRHMNDEAVLVINKCGRLPKLIVALRDYLEKSGEMEMHRLNDNFMYELKTNNYLGNFRDVFRLMHSSYQGCSQVLKKCIIYLSIFTQSSIIRRSRLVRRWIAEGYAEGTDSNSMVEYTEKLLDELANLGMIEQTPYKPEVSSDMRKTSYQVNSLFLDYIISAEKENIYYSLEVTVLQGECSPSKKRAGQHLAIGSSWKRDKFVFDSLDFLRLRSLTVSREWRPFFISDKMRVLRVLDLEDTNIKDDDVEDIMVQLPRLKFLSLRRCTKVFCLPDSLGDLRQLQTLDIRHTYITSLPKSIIKLQKLQYIRAGTSVALMEEEPSPPRRSLYGQVEACDGVKVPRGIGKLVALHTLGVINVSSRSGKAILRKLKNLTQLRKLGVSGINRRNIKVLLSSIGGQEHLESLSLQLQKDKDLDWLSKITIPGSLKRLKVYVRVEVFPHWRCLQVLGQIRRLQTLRLRFKTDKDVVLQFCDGQDGVAWPTPGEFCELKVLEVACSTNLHVKFAEGEMKELELLKVHCLERTSLKFSGLEHLTSLKNVWLKGSFDESLKQELQHQVTVGTRRNLLWS